MFADHELSNAGMKGHDRDSVVLGACGRTSDSRYMLGRMNLEILDIVDN